MIDTTFLRQIADETKLAVQSNAIAHAADYIDTIESELSSRRTISEIAEREETTAREVCERLLNKNGFEKRHISLVKNNCTVVLFDDQIYIHTPTQSMRIDYDSPALTPAMIKAIAALRAADERDAQKDERIAELQAKLETMSCDLIGAEMDKKSLQELIRKLQLATEGIYDPVVKCEELQAKLDAAKDAIETAPCECKHVGKVLSRSVIWGHDVYCWKSKALAALEEK